jgi:hypothetical protein
MRGDQGFAAAQQRELSVMGVGAQEQTMDATEYVKRDLVHVFRTYKAQTFSLHVGPLQTHIRGDNEPWKDAMKRTIR